MAFHIAGAEIRAEAETPAAVMNVSRDKFESSMFAFAAVFPRMQVR